MIDLTLDERLFQSNIISFAVPHSDPRADTLVEDSMLSYGSNDYFITQVQDDHTEDGVLLKRIEAEIDWMRLADRRRAGSIIIEGTVLEGLTEILKTTSWIPGYVTSDATVYTFEAVDATVLDLVWQWAKVTGNEVNFESNGKKVNVIPETGVDRGVSFRYTKNIQSIKRTATPPQITRLYPYGRNELDISSHTTGSVPYIEDYSYYTDQGMDLADAELNYRKDEIWVDESFIDSAALYAAGAARLATLSQPQITYEARVVDLTTLVSYNEGGYAIGDTVWVEDEPMGLSLRARVTRTVRHPYEPELDEIELEFNPILIPDLNTATARTSTTKNWELFVSRNKTTPRQVRQGVTVLNRIKLRHIEDAEWVVGYTIEATAVGSSELTLEFTNDETEEAFWSTQITDLVDGETYRFNFTFAEKEIPTGTTTFVVRGYTDSTTAGINVDPGLMGLWVLARGSTRQEVTLTDSIRYDYEEEIQYFTVPDDVTEILIECHGSRGHGGLGGGMVKAKFSVIAGTVYDVYVGGYEIADNSQPGWPNGGEGGNLNGAPHGYGGGGSSDVRPSGAGMIDTLICAGAGGGGSEDAGNDGPGAQGGFYVGGDADGDWNGQSDANDPGKGATQYAGGTPQAGSGPYDGSFNQGGTAHQSGSAFAFASGGGGGGWYGGGAAGAPSGNGRSESGGSGGGGSGWLSSAGWDLEVEDGENLDQGYIIISWETPEDVG